MKKTILHIIYDLGRGGAEMMLVNSVKELKEYNNIIVTLFSKNHFEGELVCDKYQSLNIKSLLFIPSAIWKLKKIIKENNVDLVHSHLFWPTLVARLATPKKIPLITTIHVFIANSLEYKNAHIRILDKITYRYRKNIIIAVAKGALEEYFTELKLKPYKTYLLYTFVDTNKFKPSHENAQKNNQCFKFITVGALRKQKNHQYLLKAFKELKDENIELEIYGTGDLDKEIFTIISENNLKVKLKGEVKNISQILKHYDGFIMSSTYEGFSLSVLEAMAMEMPLLLSNIKSFKEQCEETAIYFDLNNVNDLVSKLKNFTIDKPKIIKMGLGAKERVLKNFTLEQHMKGLRNIYSTELMACKN